jgi:hypothetical protein
MKMQDNTCDEKVRNAQKSLDSTKEEIEKNFAKCFPTRKSFIQELWKKRIISKSMP